MIKKAVELFLEHRRVHGCRRKTITKYQGVLGKFENFASKQGIKDVGRVSLPLVDSYRSQQNIRLSPKSMHNEAVILKTFLGWCADRGYLANNFLASQTFKRPTSEPRGGPSLEQVNQVLVHASNARMPIFAMLALTGMRAGECQHLRLEDVDFAGGWIQIVSREGLETKTGDSRKVPMHPRLREILEALPRSRRTWFFSALPSRRYPDGNHCVNMKHVNEDVIRLYRRLEILAGKKSGGYTLHSLRSFFKTFAIHAGIPREVVDQWQGHSSGRRPTASDAYYKLSDEDSQQFMQRVPFGKNVPPTNPKSRRTTR